MNRLRAFGASDPVVNYILIMLVTFLFILGTGCVVILMVEVIQNQQPSGGIVAILTAIAVAAGGLVTVSHTTNQINGTAAQASQQAASVASSSADVQAAAIAAAVHAVLASQKQADVHNENIAAAAAPIIIPSEVKP